MPDTVLQHLMDTVSSIPLNNPVKHIILTMIIKVVWYSTKSIVNS